MLFGKIHAYCAKKKIDSMPQFWLTRYIYEYKVSIFSKYKSYKLSPWKWHKIINMKALTFETPKVFLRLDIQYLKAKRFRRERNECTYPLSLFFSDLESKKKTFKIIFNRKTRTFPSLILLINDLLITQYCFEFSILSYGYLYIPTKTIFWLTKKTEHTIEKTNQIRKVSVTHAITQK